MGMLAATQFRYYLPRKGPNSTEAPDYPVTNLRLLLQPERSWRTTELGSQSVILDLGRQDIPKAYLLQDCNFASVSVALSDSSTFAYDVNPRFTATEVPKLDALNRRRAWLHDPTNTLSKQYIRITPLGAPDGGVGYYELGVVAVLTSFLDLGICPVAIATRRMQSVGRVAFKDRGEDVRAHGRPLLEATFERDDWSTAEQDVLMTLFDAGRSRPVAIFENAGDSARFYLGRRVSAVDVSAPSIVQAKIPLVIREAA